MKRQKDNKTTRKFNIVMSGQFRTLAVFLGVLVLTQKRGKVPNIENWERIVFWPPSNAHF